MKVRVRLSTGAGFGGAIGTESADVSIEGGDYEMAQGTVSAVTILNALGATDVETVLGEEYQDVEGEAEESDAPEPTTESEVDPAILQFGTSTEARAYQDLFAQSGLGTYNSQIGFMHGWAAARGYFDRPTDDQAIADGPDDGDGADDGVH